MSRYTSLSANSLSTEVTKSPYSCPQPEPTCRSGDSFHAFLPWVMSDMDNPDAVSDGARSSTLSVIPLALDTLQSWPDHCGIEFRGSHEPLPASGGSELREECSGEVGAESTSEGNVVFIYSTIIRRAITPTVQDKVTANQRQVTGREPTTETQGTTNTSISRITDIAGMFNTESRAASLANDYRALAYSGALGDGTLYPSSNRRFAGLGVGARSITAALADEGPIYDDDGDNIESVTEGDYTQRVWRQNEEHDTRECYQPIRLFQVISRGCRMMIPREKADGMDKRLGIDGTVLPDDEAPKCVFVGVSAITLQDVLKMISQLHSFLCLHPKDPIPINLAVAATIICSDLRGGDHELEACVKGQPKHPIPDFLGLFICTFHIFCDLPRWEGWLAKSSRHVFIEGLKGRFSAKFQTGQGIKRAGN
ncbi:hypothetical protein BKA56DRAFT_651648 [Ilyonectria sp. MPI-CAGE-AT-0026]|nr:hypothetical protein BKA56DRAFT_651648 [Ilyonectria sp. MPI-CAGE-AT-0026]